MASPRKSGIFPLLSTCLRQYSPFPSTPLFISWNILGISHEITVLLAIYLGSPAHNKGCVIHLHVYQTLKSLFLRLLAKSSRNSLLSFADKCHTAKQNWKRRKTLSLLLHSLLQDSKMLQQANTITPAQTAVKEQYAKRDIRLFLRKTSLRDC